MPIPRPKTGETKAAFISRCMDSMATDYPDQKQRGAICYGAWGKSMTDNNLKTRVTIILLQARKDLIRNETMDGCDYLVAPVVPIVEGVHNGEFVAYEELALFPESWDGRPLPIDHPTDNAGHPITANSPKIMESSVIGFLFNVVAREDIRGISGELWIDLDKAPTVPGGTDVLNKLQAGSPLEVSTGYFTLVDQADGEFKNPDGTVEKYTAIQRSIRPDHLALLPFDEGACNWGDGCGAPRINRSSDTTLLSQKEKVNMPTEKIVEKAADKNLKVNGDQLSATLQGALAAYAAADGSNPMLARLAVAAGIDQTKVEAIVSGALDFVPMTWLKVFAAVLDIDPYDLMMSCMNDNTDARYNKVKETATEEKSTVSTTSVTIPDNQKLNSETKADCGCKKTLSEQVKETVTNALKSLGLTKVEEKPEQEKQMDTKKAKVDALIASDKTQFSENNREWLVSLSDDQLALLEPKTEVVAEPVKETAATTTNTATVKEAAKVVEPVKEEKKEVANTQAAPEVTSEQVYKALGMTKEDFEVVKTEAAKQKAARANKVKDILAAQGNQYTEGELSTFSDSMLDKTLQILQPETPFYGGRGRVNTAEKNEVPPAPTILLAKPGVKGVDYAVPAAGPKGGR